MKLDHVAIWTRDVEEAARFWSKYFGAEIGPLYKSARRAGFMSRFVTIGDGCRIELMSGPWIRTDEPNETERLGWTHVAVSVGSEDAVRTLAMKLEADGLLVSAPRKTGDGYYEAVVRMPDGALIEITS